MVRTRVLRRVLCCLVLFILAAVTASRHWPASADGEEKSPDKYYLVARVHGNFSSQNKGKRQWQEVAAGDAIYDGDRLRNGARSLTELSIGDARVTLGPGTRATAVRKQTRGLELQSGTIRVVCADSFDAQTSAGVFRLSGEAVIRISGPAVSIHVATGKAELLRAGAAPAGIAAGEALTVRGETLKRAAADTAIYKSLNLPQENAGIEPGMGKLVLTDTLGKEGAPLEVQEMRVQAQILGPIALTEIEQTFYNPTNRRAEGTFYFALPANASISRVAMYVDGTLVEGELVERVRARKVYEEIVRKMQDPLLMEWQEGNVFKTRIFPIEPKSPKRVLISYTQLLPISGGERRYIYPLVSKMTQMGAIGSFELNVDLPSELALDSLTVPAFPDAKVVFKGKLAHVTLQRKNFQPTRDFVLRFSPLRREPMEILSDRRLNEDGFFLASYLPPQSASSTAQAEAPRDVVVLFDTSLSRRADDYKAQLLVARTVLEELGEQGRYAIIGFDVAARPVDEAFTGSDGVEASLSRLAAVMPLGATNLDAAILGVQEFLKKSPARGVADVVCISDGLATLGETALDKLLPKAAAVLEQNRIRFHAVAMGAAHDRLLLSELARKSGGLYRSIVPGDDVDREAYRLALALASPIVPAPKLSMEGAGAKLVYPRNAPTLVAGEEFICVGRYEKPGPFSFKAEMGTDTQTLNTALPDSNSSNVLIPRVWAREQLDALLLQPQNQKVVQEIIGLSQEYTLISPYTSFLVLENEGAYAQYGIDRRKRRRYWEELGKLRSAAPENEPKVAPPEPEAQATEQAPRRESPLDAINLYRLGEPDASDRIVTTALSNLCLETYYRYMQLAPDNDGSALRTVLSARPQSDIVVPPAVLDRAVLGDHFETFNPDRPDTQSAFGNPDPQLFNSIVADEAAGGGMGGASLQDMIGVGGGSGGGWGDGNGTGVGVDSGAGRGSFGNRTGGGRRLMVKRHGGSKGTESAVDMGLYWLSSQQRPDGSWGSVESTSLALLAILGAGHTEKVGAHKDAVRRGVHWLKSRQNDAGRIGHKTLEQALATMALCEAAGMGNIAETRAAAQKALDGLVALQLKENGALAGWSEDDASHPLITSLAAFALKSGKVAGLRISHDSFDGCFRSLQSFQSPEGFVGPRGKGSRDDFHLLNTTAVAMILGMLGIRPTDEFFDVVRPRAMNYTGDDAMYLRYFATQLIFQKGGDHWKAWNEYNKHDLTTFQLRSQEHGSWPSRGVWLDGRKPPAAALNGERASAEIQLALGKIRNLQKPVPAELEQLAAALSLTDDAIVLHELLNSVTGDVIRALIGTRQGQIFASRGEHAMAAKHFQEAYERGGRPENVLAEYVREQVSAKRARAALAYLLDEHCADRSAEFIQRRIAALLSDRGAPIDDAAGLIKRHLTGNPAEIAEVKRTLVSALLNGGKAGDACDLSLQAYVESGRDAKCVQLLVHCAQQAGKAKETLALLFADLPKDAPASDEHLDGVVTLLLDQASGIDDKAAAIRAAVNHVDSRLVLLSTAGRRMQASGNAVEAKKLFEAAWLESGKSEDYAQDYMQAMLAARDEQKALGILTQDLQAAEKLQAWRIAMLADVLIRLGRQPEEAIEYAAKFADGPARLGLLVALGERWLPGNPNAAAKIFEQLYDPAKPNDAIEQHLVTALIRANQPGRAREILSASLSQPERVNSWRVGTLFTLLDPDAWHVEEDIADKFAQQPAVRSCLNLLLARHAMRRGKIEVASRLYESSYEAAGRPVEAVQPYIQAMMQSKQHDKAAAELERCIQGGYHTTWAFQTLDQAYGKLERGADARMRAISSEIEIFPKDAQPRLNLAQYFEAQGKQDLALEQYVETIRIRPEDGYYYRVAVERAIALKRYDLALETLESMQKHMPAALSQWDEASDTLEILRRHAAQKTTREEFERELKRLIERDLVVVMSWDTQATDIDLYVTEPDHDVCYYSNKRTRGGGTLDHDITTGLGPETYAIRRLKQGSYKIEAHYCSGEPPTTVTLNIFRNRNSAQETVHTEKVRLAKQGDRVTVKTIEVK